MKIVFIQPKSFFTWEALNIGYLASYLKHNGYSNIEIEFYSGFFDSDEEIIKGCEGADIIGFSCTSPQMKHGLELAMRIKSPINYVVFGGFHTSALPEDTLEENDCVDAVVVGEGEKAFLEIVKGNREPIVKAEFIKDLDSIPFPDRKVIKQERNLQNSYKAHGKRVAGIFSNRGCPFHCVFCASHAVWSRMPRFRSPENIVEEFEQIVTDLKVDFVTFVDDEVGINKAQLIRFCELKIKRGIKTPWGCNVVASTLTDEMLKVMKAANCTELWIGVESGSPRIMKQIGKPITVETVKNVFKKTKDMDFIRRAYFLLGMPDEDYEDIRETEYLIEEIKPDIVGFCILAPYPGTSFYDPELHKNVDWSTVDEYKNDITSTKYLSNKELHKEQKRLVAKYQNVITYRQKNDTDETLDKIYRTPKSPDEREL